tara:strand:+ start:1484 stop:1753 length:270 start_codon:yes stop_codon:yes gene_type:complete
MGILLKEGVKFEYVSGSNSGVYMVVMSGPIRTPISAIEFKTNIFAFARRFGDGKTIALNCDDDGYYSGSKTLFRIDGVKPIKNIKEFKF